MSYEKMLLVRYLDSAGKPVGMGTCFESSERAKAIDYAKHMAGTTGVAYQIATRDGEVVETIRPA